ncbi:hypothetical protein FIBSPDRAFT_1051001 [Athelia psychrophila]|uniref:Uncharacterized protein n=1 Tax=Athelia psychrophila TaxID=1759441 RepID=A0A165ZYQ5_9AGAM|nr:hypothetical protein FIBSPDRAFT_1051001 [Fibularhizoctonia sp. CBS 109695]
MADKSMQRSISIGDISSIDKGNGLHVFASFSNNAAEGPPIRFMLDTGSTGFVIGKKNLQPAQYRLTQDRFRLVYTSSGNTYDGHWVIVSVSFYSSEGGSAVGAAVVRTVFGRWIICVLIQ